MRLPMALLICVLLGGCVPIAGHIALAGAFLGCGRATQEQEVVPSWQEGWPDLPSHKHIETREHERLLEIWR